MCIAIYKPKDKLINKTTLKRCYEANPDGAGFMYAQSKKLNIQKGFFNFDQFYEAYKKHEAKKCIIHFRIKTHGKIDETNCHPFHINDSMGFVHNGTISGFGNDIHSDTIQFNENILQKLVGKWGNLSLFEDPIVNLIEGRIGYSKLIMLDRHGNHKIFNEEKGEWSSGVWYSNTSYKPKPKYKQSNFNWDRYKWNTGSSYRSNPAKLTHSDSPEPIAQAVLAEGDECQVVSPITDQMTQATIDIGEYVEIIACNKNGTVDIITDTDSGETPFIFYNVSASKLMKEDYGFDFDY